MKSISQIPRLLFVLLGYYFTLGECIDFDRQRMAVSFEPYVKNTDQQGEIEDTYSYTLDNVKTMLEVVSMRFSRVVTTEVGVSREEYRQNFTYNQASRASVFTAEAAALINRKRGSKVLSVVIGVAQYDSPKLTEVEVLVAQEAMQKADAIFPGTVDGILIYGDPENVNASRQTLNFLKSMQRNASMLNVKRGARVNCAKFLRADDSSLFLINRDILKDSDFIMCDVAPYQSSQNNPETSFVLTGLLFQQMRNSLLQVKPKADVWCRTHWPSPWLENNETVNMQRLYWEAANNFAVKDNVTMVMTEAFNLPFRSQGQLAGPYAGWWKLTDNNKINNVVGYMEKATGIQKKNQYGQRQKNSHLVRNTVEGKTIENKAQFGPQRERYSGSTVVTSRPEHGRDDLHIGARISTNPVVTSTPSSMPQTHLQTGSNVRISETGMNAMTGINNASLVKQFAELHIALSVLKENQERILSNQNFTLFYLKHWPRYGYGVNRRT